MIPGRTYTPEDFLKIAWQHRWVILLPFALVATATVVIADRLPNLYRSETLILVVPQRIPTEYVRSTVTTRIEDRLQSISQQILSRTRLERIVEDLELFLEQRGTVPMEDLVQGMRSRIDVRIDQGDAFRVSYVANDPETAMRVTQRLASLFIDENLRDREVLAAGTSAFLESQLEQARQRLVEHEEKLEDYQRRHAGELPSQLATNLQMIQSSQLQVQSLSDALNRDRDRLLLVDRSIRDLTSEMAILAANPQLNPDGSETAPDAPAAVRLAAARNGLQAMELRFTPDHPDIARAKRLIRELEREVEEATAAAESEGADVESIGLSQSDAARRSRLSELEAERELLERQIDYNTNEQQRVQRQVSVYQARVEAVPEREAELVELTRDYETLQSLYESLLEKREDSKIAENLERRQIGEQFRVLDPAQRPTRPVSPDRVRINAAGALVGLMFGVGLVGLIEYRDQSLRNEADVRTAVSLPVLSVIPVLSSVRERRRFALVRLALGLVGCVVLLTCAGVVFWTLR